MCPYPARAISTTGSWFARGELCCRCFLLETKQHGLVLVDTGIGEEQLRNPREGLGFMFQLFVGPELNAGMTVKAQIAQLGYDPKDVRHIILTHLDLDHAGGIPDFPWAKIHVYGEEQRAAALNKRHFGVVARYRQAVLPKDAKWEVHDGHGENWQGFAGAIDVLGSGDVLLIPLAGHSAGHCGIAVKTQSHWLFHCGDALAHHAELEAQGRLPFGIQLFIRVIEDNRAKRLENLARLASAQAAGTAQIVNSHDPWYSREGRPDLLRQTHTHILT